ncbi:MAG: hypothetical protein JJE52_12680 [Acidimicrobiia bacterium]|nr:hypothetical protein [Acidimicrobiia bacterium]
MFENLKNQPKWKLAAASGTLAGFAVGGIVGGGIAFGSDSSGDPDTRSVVLSSADPLASLASPGSTTITTIAPSTTFASTGTVSPASVPSVASFASVNSPDSGPVITQAPAQANPAPAPAPAAGSFDSHSAPSVASASVGTTD